MPAWLDPARVMALGQIDLQAHKRCGDVQLLDASPTRQRSVTLLGCGLPDGGFGELTDVPQLSLKLGLASPPCGPP